MAEWFAGLNELESTLLGFLIYFAGFCAPMLSRRARAPMTRIPYLFASFGLLFLLVTSFAATEWILSTLAAMSTPFWAIVALVIYGVSTTALYGAVCGELALRRSLDCSGTRRFVLFACVPLLQLYLFFARSKSSPAAPKFPQVEGFSPAAVTGVFLVISALMAGMSLMYGYPSAAAYRAEASHGYGREAAGEVYAPQTSGLTLEDQVEDAARQLNARLPMQLPDDLVLTRVAASGREMHYFYVVQHRDYTPGQAAKYRERLETEYLRALCESDQRQIYDAGVVVVYVYSDQSGRELATLRVDAERCQ